MFIRYLAEQAMNVVKSERKPRRNIQYKDLGNTWISTSCRFKLICSCSKCSSPHRQPRVSGRRDTENNNIPRVQGQEIKIRKVQSNLVDGPDDS